MTASLARHKITLLWDIVFQLRCDKQEAMVFANELEDMLYGNAQVICTEDGENIEAGPSGADDFLFIWLQPQHKLGMLPGLYFWPN